MEVIAAFKGTALEFRNYLNLMERKLTGREMQVKRQMEEREQKQIDREEMIRNQEQKWGEPKEY